MRWFLVVAGLVAAPGIVRASPTVVPSPTPQPEAFHETLEGRWFSGGAAYGVQNVLLMGQPSRPQLLVEARAGGDRTSGYVVASGLDKNVWGAAGVRFAVVDGRSRRAGVTVDYFMSLPSRAVFFAGGVLTVGKHYARGGWSLGTQVGLAASPLPNQRPLGPNLLVDAFAAGWGRPWRWLAIGLDATVTPFTTTFMPGVTFDLAGVTERGGLRGLRLSIVEPMNLTYIGKVRANDPTAPETVVPGRVWFRVLWPAAFGRYAVAF